MEIAPIAGKSRQPSHEPAYAKREKNSTCHTGKTVEIKGGTGEGRQPPRSPHAQEKCTADKNTD